MARSGNGLRGNRKTCPTLRSRNTVPAFCCGQLVFLPALSHRERAAQRLGGQRIFSPAREPTLPAFAKITLQMALAGRVAGQHSRRRDRVGQNCWRRRTPTEKMESNFLRSSAELVCQSGFITRICSSRSCFGKTPESAPIIRSSARWFIGNSHLPPSL